jgi:hypothetical protein
MLDVADRLPIIYRAIVPQGAELSAPDVRTILKLAFLAVEIDFDEAPDEMQALAITNRMLWELSGHDQEPVPIVSPLPVPEDHEGRRHRIRELARQLASTEARELAYSVANLLAVLDLALARVEDAMLDELARELHLSPERAAELVELTASVVTPGIRADLHP